MARDRRRLHALRRTALGGGLEVPEQNGVDIEAMAGIRNDLIAGDIIRHTLDVWQQEIHLLDLGFGRAPGELLLRAVDQIMEVLTRIAQPKLVGIHAALADE